MNIDLRRCHYFKYDCSLSFANSLPWLYGQMKADQKRQAANCAENENAKVLMKKMSSKQKKTAEPEGKPATATAVK